jgi:NADP-dependent 3-hydroxy acid dehydrogenase YdfG
VQIGPQTKAIVTGASHGIGRATVGALAARGATVGMVARSRDTLEEAADPLGDQAISLVADVSDRSAIEGAVEEFVSRAGGLSLLVANAGVARYASFFEQDPADVDQMVATNVTGTFNTVRAGLGPMLDRGSGHVVVLSSGAALRAFPWAAAYGATKAANKTFAEALRHELSGTGVSLSTVFPGEVATDLHAEAEQLPDWRDTDGAIPAADVADALLKAVEEDRREVHVPANVRLLALNDLAPGLLDRLLALLRGGSAAPRRY